MTARPLLVLSIFGALACATAKRPEPVVPAKPAASAVIDDGNPFPNRPTTLQLVSLTWRREHGYAFVEGQVKNMTRAPVKNVMAVATFETADGTFITSSDALIDYNPIMPGQTSPFKVITQANPLMRSASIDFKELMGGSISWHRRKIPIPR